MDVFNKIAGCVFDKVLKQLAKKLKKRRTGEAIRLEVEATMDDKIRHFLMKELDIKEYLDKDEILKRLDAVGELKDNAICREEIREYLTPVYDLERLISKVTYQSANPRDMIAFRSSLEMLPHIKCILGDLSTALIAK